LLNDLEYPTESITLVCLSFLPITFKCIFCPKLFRENRNMKIKISCFIKAEFSSVSRSEWLRFYL
jgi:hypothetical protein